MKYAFVHEQRRHHRVTTLTCVLGVSKSGYWRWCRGEQSARARSDRELKRHIESVHSLHRGHCGALKTWKVLRLNGVSCGKHRVARIRREHGIVAKRRKRFVVTTRSKPNAHHEPNRLGRNFHRDAPDQAWVGDATYIPTREGSLYLAVLLDLFSRRVVGWSVGPRNDVPLYLQALESAVDERRPGRGLLHHSDRGSPYTSSLYRQRLEAAEMVVSMSGKGDCWDNAVAESFFATLEFECLENRPLASHTEARDAIDEFIEVYYNCQRAHQYLDYRTPIQVEDS